MFNIFYSLVISLFLSNILAYNYQVEFRDEEIFIPCPDYQDKFLDRMFEIPENITLLPDDSYYVSGDLVILYDFHPKKKYRGNIEFFKRERGNWQKTIYSMNREDLCTSMFDPREIWSPVMKIIPVNLRKCPLKKGQKFHINGITKTTFQMNSNSLEGEYWAHFEGGGDKNADNFCCVDVYFTVFRV